MSTPKAISPSNQHWRQTSPLRALSSSNREASPRAASLARLAQSPIRIISSGRATPTTTGQSSPLLPPDFRKIDPVAGTYGSLGAQRGALSRQNWQPQDEDHNVIRKHLVSAFDRNSRENTPPMTSDLDAESSRAVAVVGDDGLPFSEQFSSLQLQGGDITRQVYRFAEQSSRRGSGTLQRSHSFSYPSRNEREETVQDIIAPGGFRRNFIQRAHTLPDSAEDSRPTFLTRNFLHFLTLYGHFAGEDLEEWDEPVPSGMT